MGQLTKENRRLIIILIFVIGGIATIVAGLVGASLFLAMEAYSTRSVAALPDDKREWLLAGPDRFEVSGAFLDPDSYYGASEALGRYFPDPGIEGSGVLVVFEVSEPHRAQIRPAILVRTAAGNNWLPGDTSPTAAYNITDPEILRLVMERGVPQELRDALRDYSMNMDSSMSIHPTAKDLFPGRDIRELWDSAEPLSPPRSSWPDQADD